MRRPPELTGDFDRFKKGLGAASDEQAWETLRHTRWTTLDERTLGNTILALLDAQLTGDPRTASDALATFAQDKIHHHITPRELWNFLEGREIRPAEVAKDKNLIARARQCRNDYLHSQAFSIGDLVLPRAEAETAVTTLLDSSGSTRRIFLVGPAGIGKTGVTGQIVRRIADAGWIASTRLSGPPRSVANSWDARNPR